MITSFGGTYAYCGKLAPSGSPSGSFNQAGFVQNCTLQDSATITIVNSGTNFSNNSQLSNTGPTGINNSLGAVGGSQLNISNNFIAADNFALNVSNTGSDHSALGSYNEIAHIIEAQVEINHDCQLGNDAGITITNSGNNHGYNSSNNINGVIGTPLQYNHNYQFVVSSSFSAGDNFTFMASNSGVEEAAGNNSIGIVYGAQVQLNVANIGNNAAITVSNSGITRHASSDPVGMVTTDQFNVSNAFTAGTDLNLNVSNTASPTPNCPNTGSVGQYQISIGSTCQFDDGSNITAYNGPNASVGNYQIFFNEGFTLTSGSAIIQALNYGSTGGGIFISGNIGEGGDVNIVLENASLNIDSSRPMFTIGALNGNSTCTASSSTPLTIATDAGVYALFEGVVADYGSTPLVLTKTGPGTQKLLGSNSLSGLTTVQQGALILNGQVGPVNVNSGALFGGICTIGGDLNNNGTVSPGNSIGTIFVTGNYNNNDGDYIVEVSSTGASDLIDATGNANISGGIVDATTADGTYRFHYLYPIVEATHVVGTYAGVTAASPLIIPELVYDASHVYLTLSTDINSAAITCNQHSVALQLDSIANPTTGQDLVLSALLDLPVFAVPQALDSLSGYQYTNDLLTTDLINRQFIRRLYDPIRTIVTHEPCGCQSSSCEELEFWLEAGGTFATLNSGRNGRGFNMEGYEITGGVQTQLYSNWTIGLAASYENDRFHYKHGNGSWHAQSWLGGLYGLYRPEKWYGFVDLAYSQSNSAMRRKIEVGTFTFGTQGRPDSNQFTFYGEVGADLCWRGLLIQPFGGIEAASYHRKRIRENSDYGIELYFHDRERAAAFARLGLHLTSTVRQWLDVSFDVAWDARLTSNKNDLRGRFRDFGNSFTIEGSRFNRNSVDYALTLSTCSSECWQVYLEGAGEAWSKVELYTILGGMKYRW